MGKLRLHIISVISKDYVLSNLPFMVMNEVRTIRA